MAFVTSDKARKYLRSMPQYPPQDLQQLWPHAGESTRDLIQRMLVFNPARRITVQEALQHPYFAGLHDPTDEPVCDRAFDFSHNSDRLSCEALRQLLLAEVLHFHPEVRGEEGYAEAAAAAEADQGL
jgi:serine/threonine protein kinase